MKQFLSVAAIVLLASCSQQKSTTYNVNESLSKLEWKGSAKDHFHVGSFKVTGALQADGNGNVNGGDFIIPIASIEDYDLQEPVKKVLLDDLKSPNFFNLVLHPNATFHVTKVTPYSTTDTSAVAGANFMLTGDFSMVGQTHSVSFPAKINTNANGISAEAKFNLDRTKWGMNIYSDPTKGLYILPDVNIHLNIQTANAKLASLVILPF